MSQPKISFLGVVFDVITILSVPEPQKLTLIPYWTNLSRHLGTPFKRVYGVKCMCTFH